jgi:hypothetical protein
MKRALRIFVRVVTLPLVIPFMIIGILFAGMWALLDWLFEKEDKLYPTSEFFLDIINDFKKYWKGFFK